MAAEGKKFRGREQTHVRYTFRSLENVPKHEPEDEEDFERRPLRAVGRYDRLLNFRVPSSVGWQVVQISGWICASVLLLLVAFGLFMAAFLTRGWARLELVDAENVTQVWTFGLWSCCRDSDNLCIAPSLPGFFMAARVFALFALFTLVFLQLWLVGHALEQILQNDACGIVVLIVLDLLTVVLLVTGALCFALNWSHDFAGDFPHQVKVSSSTGYSLPVFLLPVPLLLVVAALLFAELRCHGARHVHVFRIASDVDVSFHPSEFLDESISHPDARTT